MEYFDADQNFVVIIKYEERCLRFPQDYPEPGSSILPHLELSLAQIDMGKAGDT